MSHSWLKHHVQQLEIGSILCEHRWACGQGEECTLESFCTAMDDQSAAERAQGRRLEVRDVLTEKLVPRMFPEAMALGVNNLRPGCRPRQSPRKRDHTAALQIRAIGSEQETIGGAIVYLLGPALAFIHGLAIAQAQAGRGHGRRFAEATFSVLRSVGVACVFPEACACGEGTSVRFWEKLGFTACTDKVFDDDASRTNLERGSRPSGRVLRTMCGVIHCTGNLCMFRGLADDWSVSDVRIPIPRGAAVAWLARQIRAPRILEDDCNDSDPDDEGDAREAGGNCAAADIAADARDMQGMTIDQVDDVDLTTSTDCSTIEELDGADIGIQAVTVDKVDDCDLPSSCDTTRGRMRLRPVILIAK
jgi:N-acetylglutamate synthase-like GNAT family acetyltransferase